MSRWSRLLALFAWKPTPRWIEVSYDADREILFRARMEMWAQPIFTPNVLVHVSAVS